ncbi:MAG: hypothetical protein Q7O66_19345 [Dehalococcoidia bacterium]|nr:hypothetical protein [Dehalococcoidia bacterium]
MKERHAESNWLSRIPGLGVSSVTKEKATHEKLQEEVQQLKTALRWSLAYIVNFTLGMEITDGAKVETAQIRQGIKEGLKRTHVPRGILTNLEDAPQVLKEWDSRTFRVEQDTEVAEQSTDRIVLRHADCPAAFRTMRKSAQAIIDRVSTDHYLFLPSALDFLCVAHSLCRSGLVSWLSDDRFQVEELDCKRDNGCDGVCAFAIKPTTSPHRRKKEVAQLHSGK